MGVALCFTTATTSVAGATQPEIAAARSSCEGAAAFRGTNTPHFQIFLYNVPTGGNPSVSGTATVGTQVTPFQSAGFADSSVPGEWIFDDLAFSSNPVRPSDGPATITFQWTDGLGGSGNLTQVVGIQNCAAQPSRTASAIATDQTGSVYWTVTRDGLVNGFDADNFSPGYHSGSGMADFYGDVVGVPLNAPIVGMAARPDGLGYWLLGGDGGVFTFGLAQFYGSTGGIQLSAPVVAMASTPGGNGYWLVASDGGVFAYGDAAFYGSMGGKPLNKPIVGMAVDQATGGYWLVASDGGIFSFNAPFHGSTGSLVLNQPVVGMESAPDGSGYRLAAADGGVFSFDLPFEGSYTDQDPHPMVAITGFGSSGYSLLDHCGGVYSFGSAPFWGSQIVC